MFRRILAISSLIWACPAQADELGLWRALLSVGDGAPGEVVVRADAARDSLVAIGRDLNIDEPSISMMDRMREAVIELDLGGLHKMLPNVAAGDQRNIRFNGGPEGDSRYDWTLYPATGAVNDGRLLAVAGLSTLTPVEQDFGKGQGYKVEQALDLGTGPWRHGDVAAVGEGLLAEIETAAKGTHAASALQVVNTHQPGLSATVDRAVAAAVFEAAPRTSARLSRFIVVDRVAAQGEHGLDVDFLGRLDLKGLRAMGYTTLSTYIDRLDNLLVADVSIRDRSGLPLVVMGFYSAGPGLRVAFTTRDGALLAQRNGHADPSRVVRLTDSAFDLTVRVDTEIRAEGMLLRISDYEIPVRYRSGETGADVSVPITNEPEVEFTGQGTITSWIAEIADSALNLETHGRTIFRAVAEGMDGKGSKAVIRYDDRPANGMLSTSMDLVLVDNALIRMGFRIVGRHLTPKDAVVTEAMDLLGQLIRDAEQDYAAVRSALVKADG